MQSDVLAELLPYYRRELTYLRRMGAAFADQYPKLAGRLEFSGGESSDPHVERLLESFAFLTARIQHHVESEFPEITAALLGVLYPQFLQPVPSMTVAALEVDPQQGKLTTGFTVERHTPLFAQAQPGMHCHFRTAYPVTLWPFAVTYAGFESTDRYEFFDDAADVATVLRLRLSCRAGSFADYAFDRLRFHIAGGNLVAHTLYELLFGHVLRAAILPQGSRYPVYLPADAIRPVGFERDEAVIPWPAHAHVGYRLLQEYFAFPDKFMFVDVAHLDAHASETHFDLLLLLDEAPRDRMVVDADHFRLNCTPVVNLFGKTTEPIRLDQRKVEYRLVPDVRRERTTEIHSVRRLSASSAADDETEVFQPFFSFDHAAETRAPRVFWHARRTPAARQGLSGTDLLVSFTDLGFRPALPPRQVVYAHTLCTNRHLADDLQDGTLLELDAAAPVARVFCLRRPTPQIDPPLGGAGLWKLISHLSLNYLSLSEGKESLTALKEILRLYSASGRADVDQQINGLREMRHRRVVRRVGGEAWRGFCRGDEVTLVFDERAYAGSSAFLFAAVLDRFLALYTSVNSFTQLAAERVQRNGTWKRWPPRAGEQIVL